MWTIECSNMDGGGLVTKVEARNKIDAAIKYDSLKNEWDYVYVYDEDGEYVDECEL